MWFCAARGALAQPADPTQPEVGALTAALGTAAITGRVVDTNGTGLAGVQVSDNAASTLTDAQGRYLLSPVVIGKSIVRIDGRSIGSGSGKDYGFYEIHAVARAGRTVSLGFSTALTPIDHTHDVAISSPTTRETVVTTPKIPGLELHIAPGTVIRDADGKIVSHVGITAVPLARLPYPMPAGVNIPFGYTIQPSGACLYDASGGIGYARIIYPNLLHHLPRARETFWEYEPDRQGWRAYGGGQVSADGSQIIPDRTTVITDFYSAECDPRTRSHPLKIIRPLPRSAVSP